MACLTFWNYFVKTTRSYKILDLVFSSKGLFMVSARQREPEIHQLLTLVSARMTPSFVPDLKFMRKYMLWENV